MAAGGGSRPAVAEALAAVLADEHLPTVRDLGGLGTGDLTVLAQLGLALAGEGEDGAPARLDIAAGDALPLMSSNAATFATAALVWADLCDLLEAGLGVAALSFIALQGNREAFADAVTEARPLPGITLVAVAAARAHRRRRAARAPPGPVRPALPAAGGRGARVGAVRPARRARRRDQRGRREPAVRGRRGAAQRRLPRGELRAGARQPAARAGSVRQPGRRAPVAPDGARPDRA